MDPSQVLIRPVVSEKSYVLAAVDKYTFRVHPDAHKTQIKQAVEELFDVKVEAVNTMIRKGKKKTFRGFRGQQVDVKKAVVTLAEGQRIDVTTGL